jgi:hypothetical protein
MRLALAGSYLYVASATAFAAIVDGPFPGPAGQPGSTAIHYDDARIVSWGTAVGQVVRGPYDISDPESPLVNFGLPSAALGKANGFDPETGIPLTSEDAVVSLGDGGSMTLLFARPITDGPSWDFAVFENSFDDTFLELAFVEVSSDGTHFVRFPNTSLTQTTTQVAQASATNGINATDIDGYAGKYRASWGTPFDLSILADSPGLDITQITAVRVVDVIGSIDPLYAQRDSAGRIINEPWPTPFRIGGFDLDAIGVIHEIPEPATGMLVIFGCLSVAARRRTRTGA